MMTSAVSQPERVGDVVIRASDHVVAATLDRPAVGNAINDEVIRGLEAAVDLTERHRAKVLTIRGAGGCFSVGADLAQVVSMRDNPSRIEESAARWGRLLDRLETGAFAAIAVVEGHAMAAGCELLLACDIVLATKTARIGDGHLECGLVPSAGGAVRLSRYLPKARANYLLLSGELLSGEQAAQWGLVTATADPGTVDALADRVVARIAGHSGAALAAVKRMVSNSRRLSQAEAQYLERAVFLRYAASDDLAEGLARHVQLRAPMLNNGAPRRAEPEDVLSVARTGSANLET